MRAANAPHAPGSARLFRDRDGDWVSAAQILDRIRAGMGAEPKITLVLPPARVG